MKAEHRPWYCSNQLRQSTKKYVLVDDDDIIDKVKSERWVLGRRQQQALEEDEQDAAKCEEARDRVIKWCAIHNPRSKWESW